METTPRPILYPKKVWWRAFSLVRPMTAKVCIADSNKSWICVLFLLPVSGTLMWSGWLKLMDQKPVHSAHGLTLTHIHFYHVTFFFSSTPYIWSLWNKSSFHAGERRMEPRVVPPYPPTSSLELLIKSFRELLCTASADSRNTLCIILKCQHRYMIMRFLLELYELCIFIYFFFFFFCQMAAE